jgi:hypothetical protein
MRTRLARRNRNPRRTFSWERSCLAASCVRGELRRHANNLQREKRCDAFAGNSFTLRHWLIAEQDNGAWSLITVITERRLFILRAFAVAVSLRIWCARNRGEWNALAVGAMLPQVARDRLRRRRTPRLSSGRNNRERRATARLQRHRSANECRQRANECIEALTIQRERSDLSLQRNRLSLQLGAAIHHRANEAPL